MGTEQTGSELRLFLPDHLLELASISLVLRVLKTVWDISYEHTITNKCYHPTNFIAPFKTSLHHMMRSCLHFAVLQIHFQYEDGIIKLDFTLFKSEKE